MSSAFSAVDAIKPAIYRTKRLLFQPFRFGMWWRFAALAFLTGELGNGFSAPTNGFNYRLPAHSNGARGFAAAPPFHWPSLQQILPWIVLAALVAVVLFFVLLWIGSILRFVLFESVIGGQVHIREGWRKWSAFGNSLFIWRLIYTVIMMAAYAVFIGLPVLAAWRAGLFRNPREHLFALIFGGLAFALIVALVIAVGLIVWVLTKDFVVPIMAAEGFTPAQGWRRLWSMMKPAKGDYAGYLGMKLVLAIGVGIATAIANVLAILLLAIPAIIIGVVVAVMIPSGSLAWNAVTITLVILLAVLAVAALFFIIGMVSVPAVVFFQGYSLHFFASRYDPLYDMLFPPQPPPAEAPPSGPSLEPPLAPAPA